ncbi:MAG: PEP/pyruvate-binding domain-containing protein [Candidatus Gracilibacteria bacterium]|jgi:hypothetical protein
MNDDYGAKTVNLQTLLKHGFAVPNFYAIASTKIKQSTGANGEWDPVALETEVEAAHKVLCAGSYAVRSSALTEDGKTSSLAGQFKTRLAVQPKDLSEAIQYITSFAHKYLKGHLELFSILIQEYIEADYAGVVFTRNPLGGRELILEYHKGRGEAVVSGQVKPQKLNLYWDEISPALLPDLEKAIQSFKEIERKFEFPQDIEWCIKNGKWFFLQSRPITTLTAKDYEGILYLEKNLPSSPFYFSKTEICEIAERPCPLTLDLLNRIYVKDGPVQRAYQKLGIHYEAQDFLRVLGNELYVDREAELKTLLPAYSYFTTSALMPKWARAKGAWVTFKNLLRLNRLDFPWDNIAEQLKILLEEPIRDLSFEVALENFLKDYELIFTINLGVGFAVKKNLPFPKIYEEIDPQNIPIKNLKGNSLDLADESQFIQAEPSEKQTSFEQYAHLREMGRWLTVKRINELRTAATKQAKKSSKESLAHFFLLDEFLSGNLDIAKAQKRVQGFFIFIS